MASSRRLTSILGNSQRLDGGAMFGNAPKALWSRWLEPDDQNRIPLACRTLLVQEEGRNILLETGIGSFFSPRMKSRYGVVEDGHVLLEGLAALGLGPGDIDIIVLSHLHFDHAGGLLLPFEDGADYALAFPSSTVVVGREAWERAKAPVLRDRASFIPELLTLLEDAGGLEIVSGNTSESLGEGYRFRRSFGHTPGMLHTEIAMPDGPVVFAADLIPGCPWVHLPITMGYDRYPEKLIEEKRELLDELIERKGRLFYTHDPEIAMSRVARNDKGRYEAVEQVSELRNLQR